MVSHPAVVRDLSCLAAITGPPAQAEAREQDARRSHLLATMKERTAEVPGLSPLWEELEAIDQVNTQAFSISCDFLVLNLAVSCLVLTPQAESFAMGEVANVIIHLFSCGVPGPARRPPAPGDA